LFIFIREDELTVDTAIILKNLPDLCWAPRRASQADPSRLGKAANAYSLPFKSLP